MLMKEISKNIYPIIETNYDNFSASERLAADYFLQLDRSEDLSARAVSKRLSVSEPTLSRFAKKCGCNGYREFIYDFKSSFAEKGKLTDLGNRSVLSTYQELLNKAYALIDEAQLKRIVLRMKKAGKIYLSGKGHSGLAAEEIASRFSWIGVDAVAVTEADSGKIITVFLEKRDIVIGLSLSGKNRDVIKLLQTAKEKGSMTVLITEKNLPVYKGFVDEVLLVPSREYLNQGNMISPQFPMLLAGDLLYASFVNENRKEVEVIQRKVQEALYD